MNTKVTFPSYLSPKISEITVQCVHVCQGLVRLRFHTKTHHEPLPLAVTLSGPDVLVIELTGTERPGF